MENLQPATLPAFLDPLLAGLPDPIYQITVTFLSHSIALVGAVYNIASSLISSNNSGWDIQKLLPPIITLLAAYLALHSIYRTTTWMFRLTFWFIKWGGLFGIIMAGAGWFFGSNSLSSIVNTGTISTVGSILWGLVNDPEAARPRPSRPNTRSQTRNRQASRAGERPSVWDSFDRHREWQNTRNAEAEERGPSQDVLQDILDVADKYVGSNHLTNLFGAVKETLQKHTDEGRDDGTYAQRGNGRTRSPR